MQPRDPGLAHKDGISQCLIRASTIQFGFTNQLFCAQRILRQVLCPSFNDCLHSALSSWSWGNESLITQLVFLPLCKLFLHQSEETQKCQVIFFFLLGFCYLCLRIITKSSLLISMFQRVSPLFT